MWQFPSYFKSNIMCYAINLPGALGVILNQYPVIVRRASVHTPKKSMNSVQTKRQLKKKTKSKLDLIMGNRVSEGPRLTLRAFSMLN